MISSMTGFGKSTIQLNDTTVETEIKSVNSRYLEISLKLPKNLSNKEYEVRELLRGKIKRGKLIVTIQIKKNGAESNKPALNVENLTATIDYIEAIRKAAKITEKIKIQHLLTFQDLFLAEEENESEQDYQIVKEGLNKALDELIIMRQKEGHELSKDIVKRINNIGSAVDRIEIASKASTEEYFNKIKERTKQIIDNITDYSDRMELELALLVDKSDITEECVRLKSHLRFFNENIENETEVGRKLNFLCQEINREANTIGSKSLSTEISHETVHIKEELERIREQIQNIE